ncbi:MAG: PIN domain-containing protein [Microcystis sp. LE18-22.4A]|uniref:type II toxin-antitoxin system VapC family toxin n=1 Tax=Microcystis sp. LE18-22.4A TaxID=3016432 RepID=UPI0022BEB7D4|nr:PIN domain-containing protein [Microcystis sp. LE18-22.4A]MCZ8121296.1 PIN domain-containing protein [Microcystis sp. LE18-22.4A]
MIYLDTHIVVWLYAGLTAKLSDCAKHLINENELYILPIVRLELQYLYEIGRIPEKSDDIVLELVSCLDLKVCKKDFNLIINQSVIINETRDPFERLIVSNASVDNHILLTKDYHILNHYENAVWD